MKVSIHGHDKDLPVLQRTHQSNRGLSRDMLKECMTCEILLNRNPLEEEQLNIIQWYHHRMAEDHKAISNTPLSLDLKQGKCTLLRLGGQEPYKESTITLSTTWGRSTSGSTRTTSLIAGQRDARKWDIVGTYDHNSLRPTLSGPAPAAG